MREKIKLLTASLLLTVFSIFIVTNISAQGSNNEITLSVSPPVFELSANPGEKVSNKIRVTNLSDSSQVVLVDKRNFTALGEEGGVDLTEEDTSYSLASWIQVNKEKVTIPARGSEVFNFSISVPANAEPGGHFGSLIFKTQVNPVEGQSGAAVGQEIGSLLLVKVAGDIKEEAEIASFNSLDKFYETGPVELETRIENKGNVHFKPRGKITINNMFGREVTSLQLDERNVLPGAVRKISTKWDESGFRLGRYTANLSVVYGAEGTIMNASTSFFIVPYKLILVVLAVLALIVFIVYRYRDRFREAYKALSGKQ